MAEDQYITEKFGNQEVTRLVPGKFDYRGKHRKSGRLGWLYDRAGYPQFAGRAWACATSLTFGVEKGGGRRLMAGNFCQLRLCPMCGARRARKAAIILSKVMTAAQDEHKEVQFIFLTLTMRNVKGPDLGQAITDLCGAWKRLLDQRTFERAVKGWFRAVEITRNPKDDTYHPHIHAILAVEGSYFARKSDTYITHDEWVTRWQSALRADYRPSVRIQATKGRDGKPQGMAAAEEAAKYATKDSEYVSPKVSEETAVRIVTVYTEALRRKRLTAFGGILKEIAARFKVENLEAVDLTENDEIRQDLLTFIEVYGWGLGQRDYVLESTYSVEDWTAREKERKAYAQELRKFGTYNRRD